MTVDLTDLEIDQICDGLVQNYAKTKFLESLGLRVRKKPNGRPLVNRSHYDRIMGIGTVAHESVSHSPVWGVH